MSTPFDLTGALPSGLTLLQASAGTGKTYALATLCVRYIAEQQLSASQLCVVTFTEAATSELRGRIRERLVDAVEHLGADCPPTTDPVLAHLGTFDADRRAGALRALEAAILEFDTATIATIHGFCGRVVAASGSPTADAPLGSDADQVTEIVNDLFVSRFSGVAIAPVGANLLVKAVQLRLALPDARMTHYGSADPGPTATKTAVSQHATAQLIDSISELVDTVVAEVLRRRATQRRRTFDSLITDARDVITGPSGPGTIASLRSRFRVVMIDEFQDTDTVQWELFRRAFVDGADPCTTILVGDPKQSIYRFRSAELSAYLAAHALASSIGSVFSLPTNWRSDAPLLAALDTTFGHFTFGHPLVAFESVSASPEHLHTALVDSASGAPDPTAPFQIRVISDTLTSDEARRCALGDLVREVVRLLDTTSIVSNGVTRRLRASDIGVLVRSNADASRYAHALNTAGVPAASSSNDSVFSSPSVAQWSLLLRALERPSSPSSARTAATTWFIGRSAAELAALTDDGLSELLELLRSWSDRLTVGGMPSLMAGLRANGVAARVLADPSGERDLTDLEHIAELLATATSGRPTSAAALLAIIERFTAGDVDDDDSVAAELVGRRIDRDDDTVTVLTVHKAKGLEFPIVLCPTLWTSPPGGSRPHHAEIDGERLIDANSMRPKPSGAAAFTAVSKADRVERDGEARRLLYVALTRARHRLILWTRPPAPRTTPPALAELLVHAGRNDPSSSDTPDPKSLDRGTLEVLAQRSEGTIAVVDAVPLSPGEQPRAEAQPTQHADLEVSEFRRTLTDRWRIWSFTSIKAAADTVTVALDAVADAPVIGGVDEGIAPEPDTPEPDTDESDTDAPGVAAPTPLQSAPGGTAFGTLVHAVLERVDFTDPELHTSLTEQSAAASRQRMPGFTHAQLATGLVEALAAPLGGPLAIGPLTSLAPADRLDELSFDLPLSPVAATAIAEVMAAHLPADDLLRPWFVEAAAGSLPFALDGMLTGSIDLVARTPLSAGGGHGFWLADYKTNLLRSGDYSRPALAEAMSHSGYGLQATLYLVALHRYLRWRLGDAYDPDTQLVGAVYLFMRGMTPANSVTAPGADTAGVFWWRPPTDAIVQLDLLLDTGGAS